MSNEELQRYRDLYSKYIDYAVKLHNYHHTFLTHMGLETGKSVRVTIRDMIALQKQLRDASMAAYKEHRRNTSERLAQKRAERAYRKANPLKKGRKPKNG